MREKQQRKKMLYLEGVEPELEEEEALADGAYDSELVKEEALEE